MRLAKREEGLPMAPINVVAGAADGSGGTEVERSVKETLGGAERKAVGPGHVAPKIRMVGRAEKGTGVGEVWNTVGRSVKTVPIGPVAGVRIAERGIGGMAREEMAMVGAGRGGLKGRVAVRVFQVDLDEVPARAEGAGRKVPHEKETVMAGGETQGQGRGSSESVAGLSLRGQERRR